MDDLEYLILNNSILLWTQAEYLAKVLKDAGYRKFPIDNQVKMYDSDFGSVTGTRRPNERSKYED